MQHDPSIAPADAPTVGEAPAAAAPRQRRQSDPNRLLNHQILFLANGAGEWIASNLRRLGKWIGNPILDIEVTGDILPLTDQWQDEWIPKIRAKGYRAIQVVDEKGVGVWQFDS